MLEVKLDREVLVLWYVGGQVSNRLVQLEVIFDHLALQVRQGWCFGHLHWLDGLVLRRPKVNARQVGVSSEYLRLATRGALRGLDVQAWKHRQQLAVALFD